MINKMLCDALSLLFQQENLVSTTRRGAGFAIMFLHVVKNDEQAEMPILKHARDARDFPASEAQLNNKSTRKSE